MYKLESENLLTLTSMGSSTTTNYIKYFLTIDDAKKYAEIEFKSVNPNSKKIQWKPVYEHFSSGDLGYSSGDLGYVMYNISGVSLEITNIKFKRKLKLMSLLKNEINNVLENVDKVSKDELFELLKQIKKII